MKILTVMFLILSSSNLLAANGQSVWMHASPKDKIFLLNGYRDFFQEWHEQNSHELSEFKTSYRFNLFMNEAWASSEMNCIYAGWPSKRVNNFCSSPQKQNPDYQNGSCAKNQMQCQPLLFGKGHCVSVESQKERNLAFTNCDKKFLASKKPTADLINEILADGKERELLELIEFADNICSSGAQAKTGMCKRLQRSLERVKNISAGSSEIAVKKSPVETPTKQAIINVVEKVSTIVSADTPPLPQLEICEPEVTGDPFERETPREGVTDYLTSKESTYWAKNLRAIKGEKEPRSEGFELNNKGPNAIADGKGIEPYIDVERSWNFVSSDNSRQESYLWITDDSGSGKFSHLMESIIMIVPRKVMPSVEVVGQDLHVTLTTGEKVIYDKDTRIVKSGVLSEGKIDMNPDRFKKKFAPVKYSGQGISIRVDKRGEDPRLIPGNATVTQNGKSCQVPAKELWDAKASFKYSDDAHLVQFLNSKCGKKFSL